MPRIFLIRHGEPVSGWGEAAADPGLSDAGRTQAEAAAHALNARGRLAIVSSPMLRCRETATPFEQLTGMHALIEPRVSEVVTPIGVGDRRAWLRENFAWAPGSEPRAWSSVDPALRGWRAEVLAAIRALRQDTAVFTHFIAINAIVTTAIGSPHTIGCRPGFASVTELLSERGTITLIAHGEEMRVDDVR
jgi:broad specificity phosphatase PhoE